MSAMKIGLLLRDGLKAILIARPGSYATELKWEICIAMKFT